MLIHTLKSKIHRATVTDANLEYEGSITLDEALITAAGLTIYEMVHIWDVTSGNRLTTYVMPPAPKGSGVVCINGAAAHLVKTGNIIIISSFADYAPEELKGQNPTKVLVDAKNQIQKIVKMPR